MGADVVVGGACKAEFRRLGGAGDVSLCESRRVGMGDRAMLEGATRCA